MKCSGADTNIPWLCMHIQMRTTAILLHTPIVFPALCYLLVCCFIISFESNANHSLNQI